jgi:hypothetical protein
VEKLVTPAQTTPLRCEVQRQMNSKMHVQQIKQLYIALIQELGSEVQPHLLTMRKAQV